ncbi:MAG: hypothetical protein Q4P15_08965 [Propionibacteriaceae bacterium]|nr:hypothetical protein [Propionibacteriaceae bacterium]
MQKAPAKTGPEELRTDLAPLVTRLPKLADVDSAQWMGGILGDRSVPGPSTYWLDAVVVLDEKTLKETASLPGLVTVDPPVVVRGLKASMPKGNLRRSETLDDFFTIAPWRVEAWLAEEEGQVVLFIVGGYH